MYIAAINKMTDSAKIVDYVKKNGFGTLISYLGDRPIATHIPMFLDQKKDELYLYGHIARGNEQGQSFDNKQLLLAIFMADHAYISSSWYDHVNVPTWNYVAIHLYGTAIEISGEMMMNSIDLLVDHYETGRENRFHAQQMSPKEREAHYRGLVAFEMKVSHIHAAEKLSQNRKDKDYYHVISHLENGDDASRHTAEAMLKLRPKS